MRRSFSALSVRGGALINNLHNASVRQGMVPLSGDFYRAAEAKRQAKLSLSHAQASKVAGVGKPGVGGKPKGGGRARDGNGRFKGGK